MKAARWILLLVMALLPIGVAVAQPGITIVNSTPTAGGGQSYSVTIQILLLMTALTLLPSAVMMMTSFTRIVIVLSILRQALGTPQTPSSQIIIGLGLFLTVFVMMPVFSRVNTDALQPYLKDQISGQVAVQRAQVPFRKFMLAQTRESDLALFAGLAKKDHIESPDDVPFSVLVPAFVTSELKTAFQIGFLIFIPFVVIDLVVASLLMSMGMMMLSPMMISLPFKLMLFVLVDGWTMVLSTLTASFHIT
ncbi:MAG: flagellar type III secretion system pore protein FliP [Gammaproteobacteria bacterium]